MSQIIFFDGICVLCNGFADFILRWDVKRSFRLAPLQGERAKELLPGPMREGAFDTVVLWSDGQIYVRSDAVMKIFTQLGGPWILFNVFWVLPRPVRDLAYRTIARNRYRWFGKRETCRLPLPEERGRFLD
jgi:predicted DCC family thiol-disulfide oxidoreductase YuxK